MWRVQESQRRLVPIRLVHAAIFVVVGCGPHSGHLAVSGRVTLDGVPLDSGSIRFNSLEGQQLSASGALIEDGQYYVPQEKGLLPGTYRVEMTSPDLAAPPVMVRETPDGPGIPAAPNRIPPEYNIDSQHTVEVTADGDNYFEFEIVNKPVK